MAIQRCPYDRLPRFGPFWYDFLCKLWGPALAVDNTSQGKILTNIQQNMENDRMGGKPPFVHEKVSVRTWINA